MRRGSARVELSPITSVGAEGLKSARILPFLVRSEVREGEQGVWAVYFGQLPRCAGFVPRESLRMQEWARDIDSAGEKGTGVSIPQRICYLHGEVAVKCPVSPCETPAPWALSVMYGLLRKEPAEASPGSQSQRM